MEIKAAGDTRGRGRRGSQKVGAGTRVGRGLTERAGVGGVSRLGGGSVGVRSGGEGVS